MLVSKLEPQVSSAKSPVCVAVYEYHTSIVMPDRPQPFVLIVEPIVVPVIVPSPMTIALEQSSFDGICASALEASPSVKTSAERMRCEQDIAGPPRIISSGDT